MAAKLSRISTLANKLNNSTEKINAKIREVSDGLTAMNIGIEVWLLESYLGLPHCDIHYDDKARQAAAGSKTVPVDKRVPHANGNGLAALLRPNLHLVYSFDAQQLGFAKVEDKWQIATRTVTRDEFEGKPKADGTECAFRVSNPRNVTPLLKAPRAIRLAALPLLDALTDEIAEILRQRVDELNAPEEEGGICVSVFNSLPTSDKKKFPCEACHKPGASPENPLLAIGDDFRTKNIWVHENCLLPLIEKAKITPAIERLEHDE